MANFELKGLKGLRELNTLTQAPPESAPTTNVVADQLLQLPTNSLIPGQYQPRKLMPESELQELAESIKKHGILQPIIVRRLNTGYEIIAGERRWQAAKIASLENVPVIIKEIDDTVALAFALIENIQRQNLNPIEEAMAFARFQDEFQMNHNEIAEMVGRSRSSISNALRLLALSDDVKVLLANGELEMGHARALLTLPPNLQTQLAERIAQQNLTVRDAERLVQEAKQAPAFVDVNLSTRKNEKYQQQNKLWSRILSDKFSTPVAVRLNNSGVGKVVIQVDSPDEVEWLIEHTKVDN